MKVVIDISEDRYADIQRIASVQLERKWPTPEQIIAKGVTINELREWIPVTERLPEEKGEHLVTYHPCYWDNVQQDIKVGIDSFRGKTSWAKKKYQMVIAWMPLPPAYKEEEE